MSDGARPVWTLLRQAIPLSVCSELADRIEWEAAASMASGTRLAGPLVSVDVVDPELVHRVWENVGKFAPPTFEGCPLVGPHSTVRLLRYEATDGAAGLDAFHPLHADTPLAAPGSYSRLTALVYVNSKFVGGRVRFFGLSGCKLPEHVDVQPLEGTVLICDHRILHQAAVVTCGVKRLVKLSVLYALARERGAPTGQISVFDADRDVRLPFAMAAVSAVRNKVGHGASAASSALSTTSPTACALKFVGSKEDEFDALVKQARFERAPEAPASAHERLLDFVLRYDLCACPDDVAARGFQAMTTALNTPCLKLRGYQAFDAAVQLHHHDFCILLAETLIKDAGDSDPDIRLAAINALFRLLPPGCEECRGSVVAHTIRSDPSPRVRLRAIEGVAALAKSAVSALAAIEEISRPLLDMYGDALLEVVSRSNGGQVPLPSATLQSPLRSTSDSSSSLPLGTFAIGHEWQERAVSDLASEVLTLLTTSVPPGARQKYTAGGTVLRPEKFLMA